MYRPNEVNGAATEPRKEKKSFSQSPKLDPFLGQTDKKSDVFCKRMILLVLTLRLFLAESLQPHNMQQHCKQLLKILEIIQENSRFK